MVAVSDKQARYNAALMKPIIFLLYAMAAAGAQTLTCPASLTAKAAAGWTVEGKPGVGAHAFERVSIYNKDTHGEYDLAPDEERKEAGKIVQVWKLSDYREMPLYLRCRYRGTDATLTRELPAALKTCEFGFQFDKRGNIVSANGAGKPEVRCQ